MVELKILLLKLRAILNWVSGHCNKTNKYQADFTNKTQDRDHILFYFQIQSLPYSTELHLIASENEMSTDKHILLSLFCFDGTWNLVSKINPEAILVCAIHAPSLHHNLITTP